MYSSEVKLPPEFQNFRCTDWPNTIISESRFPAFLNLGSTISKFHVFMTL